MQPFPQRAIHSTNRKLEEQRGGWYGVKMLVASAQIVRHAPVSQKPACPRLTQCLLLWGLAILQTEQKLGARCSPLPSPPCITTASRSKDLTVEPVQEFRSSL